MVSKTSFALPGGANAVWAAMIAALVGLVAAAQLMAQVPATVHVVWIPNPSTDNVVQYALTLDSLPPVIVLPASCTSTACTQVVTVPTFGLHSVSVFAQNLKLTSDPTSLQNGPAVLVSFTLGSVPVVVAGLKVTN